MDYKIYKIISDWKEQVNDHQKENYKFAKKFNNYHYGIGLPATIIAAAAGTTLLVGIEEPGFRISIGIVGIIAAILSAVQTFYSYAKRAENHILAVAQLGQVRRDIEIFERFVPERKSERDQRIREMNERISSIGKGTPPKDIMSNIKKWPWILLGFSGSIMLILMLYLGNQWFAQINQQSEENQFREAVHRGIETWEFEPNDPLLKQRIILINTWINELTSHKVITLLAYLNAKDNEAPITIYLISNGGFTKDAYAIVQAIQDSESVVSTVALGDCFSACTKILMSGTGDRKIAQYARIAVHTQSYPHDDDPFSINTVLHQREWEFYRDYSEIPLEWIDRKENFYYFSPERAVEYQIADEIMD